MFRTDLRRKPCSSHAQNSATRQWGGILPLPLLCKGLIELFLDLREVPEKTVETSLVSRTEPSSSTCKNIVDYILAVNVKQTVLFVHPRTASREPLTCFRLKFFDSFLDRSQRDTHLVFVFFYRQESNTHFLQRLKRFTLRVEKGLSLADTATRAYSRRESETTTW